MDNVPFWNEKRIRELFDISLFFKGAFAALEVIAGISAYFATQGFVLDLVRNVVSGELSEDPRDVVANALLHWAQNIPLGAHYFAAIYLLGHGVVKLWLIAGLIRKRLWYYPTAIAVFGLFIVYQMYRYAITGSVGLILLTILDIVVIALTWHEYKYLKRSHL